MTSVAVRVVRFVEDGAPALVEFHLVDATGRLHQFIDKTPMLESGDELADTATYLIDDWIRCEIEEAWTDSSGRELVRVTTKRPDCVMADDDQTVFVVYRSQLRLG